MAGDRFGRFFLFVGLFSYLGRLWLGHILIKGVWRINSFAELLPIPYA
jgi:hypothetical protein